MTAHTDEEFIDRALSNGISHELVKLDFQALMVYAVDLFVASRCVAEGSTTAVKIGKTEIFVADEEFKSAICSWLERRGHQALGRAEELVREQEISKIEQAFIGLNAKPAPTPEPEPIFQKLFEKCFQCDRAEDISKMEKLPGGAYVCKVHIDEPIDTETETPYNGWREQSHPPEKRTCSECGKVTSYANLKHLSNGKKVCKSGTCKPDKNAKVNKSADNYFWKRLYKFHKFHEFTVQDACEISGYDVRETRKMLDELAGQKLITQGKGSKAGLWKLEEPQS